MNRVLVFGMTENPGGVENFLMNYCRHFDRKRIRMDFLCNFLEKAACEDELVSMGSRVFHIVSRRKNPLRYRKELAAFFAGHAAEYDAIWVNVSSLANIDYLRAAKKYGIDRRIIHSHNSQNMDGCLRGLLHRLNPGLVGKYATDFWACSWGAAGWFYNDRLIARTVIIHNAIEVENYIFDPEKRHDIREKLHIEGKYVIGNVGRLHFQKNQSFAIDVFARYLNTDEDTVLVLVGRGEDEAMLKDKVNQAGITDRIIFAGVQSDMQAWLSAFDVFLFPSVFEGLSIAALEAQANGLPILASVDALPQEARLNDNIHVMELKNYAENWAQEIRRIKEHDGRKDAGDVRRTFTQNGYDISTEAGKIERYLLR